MKRKKIFICLIAMLILVGCSSNESATKKAETEEKNQLNIYDGLNAEETLRKLNDVTNDEVYYFKEYQGIINNENGKEYQCTNEMYLKDGMLNYRFESNYDSEIFNDKPSYEFVYDKDNMYYYENSNDNYNLIEEEAMGYKGYLYFNIDYSLDENKDYHYKIININRIDNEDSITIHLDYESKDFIYSDDQNEYIVNMRKTFIIGNNGYLKEQSTKVVNEFKDADKMKEESIIKYSDYNKKSKDDIEKMYSDFKSWNNIKIKE